MREVVKARSWQLNIMENGFIPDFISLPPKYDEKNNKSAVKNMEVVREKVAVWLKEGHVEKLPVKATCNSPQTVSDKLEVDTGKVKKRVCLDLSRHVNKFLEKHPTNFEDLAQQPACTNKEITCVFSIWKISTSMCSWRRRPSSSSGSPSRRRTGQRRPTSSRSWCTVLFWQGRW